MPRKQDRLDEPFQDIPLPDMPEDWRRPKRKPASGRTIRAYKNKRRERCHVCIIQHARELEGRLRQMETAQYEVVEAGDPWLVCSHHKSAIEHGDIALHMLRRKL